MTTDPIQPKFLCVCEAGIVRSGALAYSLRYNFGQSRVLQASHAKTTPEDLDLLGEWADYIVVLESKFAQKFLMKWKAKIRVLDVGPDVWKNPLDPKLQDIVSEAVQRWSALNWKI